MRIAGFCPKSNKPITVVTEGETIAVIEDGINSPDIGSADLYIGAGMIDLMVPGYGGNNFSDPDVSVANIHSLLQKLYASGTTHIYPLIITSASEVYPKVLQTIDAFAKSDTFGKSIVGVHIEGPYLSPEKGPRGAHHPQYMHDPDFDEFSRWQQISGNRVSMITLAPERPGSIEFIRKVRQTGVKVSIGHTVASKEQMEQAILAGADISTHLGNGADALIHRWDNYIFRQLADDRLWAGVIADGHHLPDSNLRIWFRTKGKDRIIMVSDVAAQAGLEPGIHQAPDGAEILIEPDGRIVMNNGSGNLAGAGHMLNTGIAKSLQIGEFSLGQCLDLATSNPARYMGLSGLGSLEVGKEASMFLFEKDIHLALKVRATILAGESVYSA